MFLIRRLSEETRFRARTLRRHMTQAEQLLWQSLRKRRFLHARFRKQVPIGPYFADFACVTAKLIIELDGAPHEDNGSKAYDRLRDAWLAQQDWMVLRFHNDLILGGSTLVDDEIAKALQQRMPRYPSRRRRREKVPGVSGTEGQTTE